MRINFRGGISASAAGTLIVAVPAFLLVAGVGAATSYLGSVPETSGLAETGPNAEMMARLGAYARSIGGEDAKPMTTEGETLPDVDAMIDQLAARLQTAPEDIDGWRMLGWSYFNTTRYEEAATAYAKAVELDPSSTELKLLYEDAKAKASGSVNLATASPRQTEGSGGAGGQQRIDKNAGSGPMPPLEHDAAVLSMVDGLSKRLETSPRDVEGWTLLIRSRSVLGERDVATTALRRALKIFKDDSDASAKIKATAEELGLTAE
jgi:cytochrome c-type biogenesis protein CcmH